MKKIILFGLIFMVLIGTVSASKTLNTYVNPKDENGSSYENTYFEYVFNFTNSADCTNVILSAEKTVTTDDRGIGFIEIDLSSLNYMPKYMCEYRNGTSRANHTQPDSVLRNVYALNITANKVSASDWTNVSISSGQITDPENLDTNSSTYWGSMSSFNLTWFYQSGIYLMFNETYLVDTYGNWLADKTSYYTSTQVDTLFARLSGANFTGNVSAPYFNGEWNGSSNYYTITDADNTFINNTDINNTDSINLNFDGNYLTAELNCSGVTDGASDHLSCDEYGNLIVADDWYNSVSDIPTATPSNGDTTHLSTADQIYDWVIGLGYTTLSAVVNSIGNWTADKGNYYNSSQVDIALDAQDACSEITGCVENAITNSTMNKTVSCSDIIGSPDSDFCTDTDTWNTSTQILAVINDNGYWNESGDISSDGIPESKLDFDTSCAAGNHLYISGNDLACEVDKDTYNTTSQMITAVNGTELNLTKSWGYPETDSSHDECSEITGCVENAITNSTMNKTVSCSDIIGSPDSDFCTDMDTNTYNTTSDFHSFMTDNFYWNSSYLIGYNNLTKCSNGQILKMSGTNWLCGSDVSGSGSGANYWGTSGSWMYPNTTSGGQLNINTTGYMNASIFGSSSDIWCNSSNCYSIADFILDTDTNTQYINGSGLTLTGTQFNHSDTSSQTSSDNSGRTYIQDIILDTFGHITSITTATETVTDTDTWNTSTQILAVINDNGYWNESGDISSDGIPESKLDFDTSCAAGNHLYISGNDLACEVDKDTYNTTSQMITAVNGTELNLTKSWGYPETDSSHDECSEITNCVSGAITQIDNWALDINDYPSGCSPGQAVTQMGDTLTCSAFQTGNELWNTTAQVWAVVDNSTFLKADGSQVLTANWDAGPYNITANGFLLNDNERLWMGNSPGVDASMYFNGTCMIMSVAGSIHAWC